MSSTSEDNSGPVGGNDSEDCNTKDQEKTTTVSKDGVAESLREVPNEPGKENIDVCSEKSKTQLQTTYTVNKRDTTDIQDTSENADSQKDNIDQCEKGPNLKETNTQNEKESQIESTYFGSPKKTSISNIVLEVQSSLKEKEKETFAENNSKETVDKTNEKPDSSEQESSSDIAKSQHQPNGLTVSESTPQKNKSLPRGILKNTKSEPLIVISGPNERLKNSDSTGLIETSRPTWPKYGKRKFFNVSTSASYFRTTQEFVNPAFELDENIPTDSKLSDIVELVMKQQTDENRYVHPFGQSNMYSSVFLDNTPTVIQNTERVVFWLIFIIMLVGLAGAIILMAEMYRQEGQERYTLTNATLSS